MASTENSKVKIPAMLHLCRLEQSGQFYRTFPIANAVRSQLNWTQYRMLIQIDDCSKREYYELEAVKNAWTGRELELQINPALYERQLLSNDKETVLAVARNQKLPELPHEIIKDPTILEFLGLERKSHYSEEDLETSLIGHLQQFLLDPSAFTDSFELMKLIPEFFFHPNINNLPFSSVYKTDPLFSPLKSN